MYVYKDVINGGKLFVDLSPISEVDDFVYEVECPKEGDILEIFNIQPVEMDKNTYHQYTRKYLRRLTHHMLSKSDNREEVLAFGKSFDAYVKDKVLPHFDDFEPVWVKGGDGMVLLIGKRDDGTIYLKYWKHGLEREEVEEENERYEWEFKYNYGKYGSHHEWDEDEDEDEN
ncbi:Mss4-like protein [Aspergillus minisclerotigenes]|uniref:Translationally-controlled tumor protein homolog n=1 Tax=Aspergillus minisclerotigenes TaxID=656917 RepID=A0A5N6IXS8_9EURO|nr:Mss4-like protein [Aspergillus minisclerotigenes]